MTDPAPDVAARAERRFEQLAGELGAMCPGAEVLHVGGTAIPGVTTKGDLDVQIRVPRTDFAAARASLAGRYAANEGGFQLPDGCSFEDKDSDPPIGVHLTVIGGACDVQWVLTAMLVEDAALSGRYAAIKRRFEGKPMAAYRDAKAGFFEELQDSPRFAQIRGDG